MDRLRDLLRLRDHLFNLAGPTPKKKKINGKDSVKTIGIS